MQGAVLELAWKKAAAALPMTELGRKRHLVVMQVEVDHDRSQRAAAPFVLGCTALRARPAFLFFLSV